MAPLPSSWRGRPSSAAASGSSEARRRYGSPVIADSSKARQPFVHLPARQRRNRAVASSQAQNSGGTGESYFQQSRRPLASLVFVLPLVLLYELGTWWFHLDASRHTETRIVAFTWIREAFAHFGATGPLLAPAAVIGLLLGWHLFARHPNRVRPTVPAAMAGESAMLSLPLLLLVGVVTGTHLLLTGDAREW